jgi:hypothetical protein
MTLLKEYITNVSATPALIPKTNSGHPITTDAILPKGVKQLKNSKNRPDPHKHIKKIASFPTKPYILPLFYTTFLNLDI